MQSVDDSFLLTNSRYLLSLTCYTPIGVIKITFYPTLNVQQACHNQIDPYISYNIFVLVTYVQRPLFCFGATKFGCKVNVKINVNVMIMLNVNILSTISRSILISSSRWLLKAGLMDRIQCQILRWRQCFYLVSFIQILLRLCNIVYSQKQS